MTYEVVADLYLAGSCTDALRQVGPDQRRSVEHVARDLQRAQRELGAAVCAALGASPDDVPLRCDSSYRERRRRERIAAEYRQEQFWEQHGPRDE